MESYTRAELVASREGLWTVCQNVFDVFEKCKMEKGNDPERCLRESTAVLGCAQKVMRQVVKNCEKQLDNTVKCVEENNMRTLACQNEEKELQDCFDTLVAPHFLPSNE
ncbi:hypothetical protein RB653_000960 [Dictyostelium firmibasis]|uniref:Uncharacterized protein n=1 Tax=Dictyostelium firmibasis TaxID=79012 RepID=A0AAN7U6N0_9MYCE